MPPKISNFSSKGRPVAAPSFARSTVQALISPDNRSVISAIGMFAVGVAFLHSSWAEILLPA
ncbi:hypothetical protein K505DRAFT_377895 [Melanomma pulvis-pyrius CBS 109.77]|uniref:TOM core complex subunit Tom6 n=1 Tax=Melanomma pulvis-pyrius CBS 109.77 TaxID=1314802 RepID=A0A6A6X183_9PLEO|nr:hypothetical protein K505DRAFT_377895 [Melanomma pulvis-pyrius CBS 109.77]